jgi:hypothetical protein
MSLLLTMGVVLTVAAFGRVMVLYLDSRAKYLNRLRPTLHTQISRSTTRLFTGANDRRVDNMLGDEPDLQLVGANHIANQ